MENHHYKKEQEQAPPVPQQPACIPAKRGRPPREKEQDPECKPKQAKQTKPDPNYIARRTKATRPDEFPHEPFGILESICAIGNGTHQASTTGSERTLVS